MNLSSRCGQTLTHFLRCEGRQLRRVDKVHGDLTRERAQPRGNRQNLAILQLDAKLMSTHQRTASVSVSMLPS